MRPNMRPCSQEMGFGMKISGFAAIGRYVSSWAVAHERRKETMPCFSSISTYKEASSTSFLLGPERGELVRGESVRGPRANAYSFRSY